MKYLLISKQTAEQTLCDKVTIDGFDYYVSNGQPNINDFSFNTKYKWIKEVDKNYLLFVNYEDKKVMATTNPNLDIPQVVDEVEKLAKKYADEFEYNELSEHRLYVNVYQWFIQGYNKSQETHPFSEGDMIEFAEWVDNMGYRQVANGLYKSINDEKGKLTKELLQLWKEQKPQKIYYTQTNTK